MNDIFVRIFFRLLCAALPLQIMASWLGEVWCMAMNILVSLIGLCFLGRIVMLAFFKKNSIANERLERLTTDILTFPYSVLLCGMLFKAQGLGTSIDFSIAFIAALVILFLYFFPAAQRKNL